MGNVLFDTNDYLEETDMDLVFFDWEMFRDQLLAKVEDHNCIFYGYEWLWNGKFDAGFCGDLKEAIDTATMSKDGFKFEVEDGDLFITTYHHDGHNRYKIRKLTDEGEEVWGSYTDPESDYYDLSKQEMHKILLSTPFSEQIVFD